MDLLTYLTLFISAVWLAVLLGVLILGILSYNKEEQK